MCECVSYITFSSAFASRVDQMVSPRPYPTARSTSSRKGEGKGKGNKDRKGPQEPKEETRGKSQSRVGVRSDSLESERERTPFLHQVWAWLFETREQFRSSAPAAQQQRTRHARCTCARHRAARWPHRGAPSPPLQRAPCWLRSVDHRWGARVDTWGTSCSSPARARRTPGGTCGGTAAPGPGRPTPAHTCTQRTTRWPPTRPASQQLPLPAASPPRRAATPAASAADAARRQLPPAGRARSPAAAPSPRCCG
mmetsp:Transcript_13406/g.38908  ORF Transcript_13406/g.38908 Transcript_13406/m.38908 type:complete len:253 (-) Transcript_13406:1016-1774(-)